MNVRTSLSEGQLKDCANAVGMTLADFHPSSLDVIFKLRVNDDNDNYISWNPLSGRKIGHHVPCWHGYRDFYYELFNKDPNARVIAGQMGMPKIVYNGYKDFQEKYPDTYYMEMGSMIFPYQYKDKCNHA